MSYIEGHNKNLQFCHQFEYVQEIYLSDQEYPHLGVFFQGYLEKERIEWYPTLVPALFSHLRILEHIQDHQFSPLELPVINE